MSRNFPRTAIVGATGAVGQTMLELFIERDIQPAELRLVASSSSAGRRINHRGTDYVVEDLATTDFSDIDLVFFSAGTEVSRKWAPVAAKAGSLVIDNTNAFRMDDASPLVVPQVNAKVLATRPSNNIIANPNCSTIPLVRLLRPLDEAFGLSEVVATTYQAASGRGRRGVDDLARQSREVLADPATNTSSEVFTPGLAFNVVPSIDRLQADRFTLEEQKMRQETRKILGRPDLRFTATCVRVPVYNSHSVAAYARFREPVDLTRALTLIADEPEMRVHDLNDPAPFPTPREVRGEPDLVHAGRLRVDPEDPHGFWSWVVADNLRIGAALNAVQIAESLHDQGEL